MKIMFLKKSSASVWQPGLGFMSSDARPEAISLQSRFKDPKKK